MLKPYKVLLVHTVEEVVIVLANNGKESVDIVQGILDNPKSGNIEVNPDLTETTPRKTTGAWCLEVDDDNPLKCVLCGAILNHKIAPDGVDYNICPDCGAKA